MHHLTQRLYQITKSTLFLALFFSVLSLAVNTMQVSAQTRGEAITELKRRLQERLANDNRAPRKEKAAEGEAQPSPATTEANTAWQEENFQDNADPRKTAIVGSWLGTSGEGNKLINSFTSDGVITGSVQSEVSTIPELGVLTPAHGVWKYLGGRRFGITAIGILYDINTGDLLGYLKAQPVLTINRAGDEMSGTDKVEILDPDGNVVFSAAGESHFKRIKFESAN